jgi:hypothetical protein
MIIEVETETVLGKSRRGRHRDLEPDFASTPGRSWDTMKTVRRAVDAADERSRQLS